MVVEEIAVVAVVVAARVGTVAAGPVVAAGAGVVVDGDAVVAVPVAVAAVAAAVVGIAGPGLASGPAGPHHDLRPSPATGHRSVHSGGRFLVPTV